MSKHGFIEQARRKFLQGIGIPKEEEFVIDDFQADAIAHVASGHDTLVVAPTGSGKTFIALSAIEQFLLQGKRAVYTTPLKALSNTKYAELKLRFEPQFKVGLLTGDRKIEGDADVVVATTEIFRNELYRATDRTALVVLDEVHFIADPQRGPVWEESIILAPAGSTFLMLSASISNYNELAEWIAEVRGQPCKIVIKTERPVQLRYGFLHPDLGVLPLANEHGEIFGEVKKFYGSMSLDSSGMRLRVRRQPRSRIPGRRHKGKGRRR
ncbi:MAG: DEAD/DEAH box helicase [Deltaproteobacteria bacterium]|nr:DEAD/DEAH box helicase [Deltaproteobacteria bacterium]